MNLFDGTAEDVRRFVTAVTGLAVRDFETNHKARSGDAIVSAIGVESYRVFHCRMATGIYNQTQQTLRLMQRERASE